MSWFTDTFSTVGDFFTNLWDNVISPDLKTAEQVAEAFFSAAVTDAASQLGIVGMKIVTDAVAAAENAGGSGSAKLAAAVAAVTADLATAGVTAASHIINAAIEAAVAQLNAAKATVPVAPVEPVAPPPEAPAAA